MALSAVAGVLKTMFADVSSIHSILVGGWLGKCSAEKPSTLLVVRLSKPRMYILCGVADSESALGI